MKSGVSKSFLKSSSDRGLERKMLKHSIIAGGFIDYQIIFADGVWYAWFNADILEKLKSEINQKKIEEKKGVGSGV